jgi:hypothetical protein
LLREKIQEDWNFFSSPQSADTILKEVVKLIKTDISLTDAALRGRRGLDRIVAGFTTTYAIRAYHH